MDSGKSQGSYQDFNSTFADQGLGCIHSLWTRETKSLWVNLRPNTPLSQESGVYSLQIKSGSQPAFVNEVILEDSPTAH